jgi:hypothetical protein
MVDVANMTIEARMGWCQAHYPVLWCFVCGGAEIWKSPEAVVF